MLHHRVAWPLHDPVVDLLHPGSILGLLALFHQFDKEDLLIGLEHVTHSYKERMISFEQNVLFQFGRFNLVIFDDDVLS